MTEKIYLCFAEIPEMPEEAKEIPIGVGRTEKAATDLAITSLLAMGADLTDPSTRIKVKATDAMSDRLYEAYLWAINRTNKETLPTAH